jgi:hypothetical protein
MSGITEFEIIRIVRSDGKDTGPDYRPATTDTKAPKKTPKDAPEKAARAKPQLVRLAEDDPRFVDWRIKLGILLKQELLPNPEGMPSSQATVI